MANVYFKMLRDSIIKEYSEEPISSLQTDLLNFADTLTDKNKLRVKKEQG